MDKHQHVLQLRKNLFVCDVTLKKSEETILSWTGMSYALEPQKQQEELFGLFGINLARCWYDEEKNGWQFTSRELQYYLDPKTNKPMYKYDNPW